jgi:hypothetical protein
LRDSGIIETLVYYDRQLGAEAPFCSARGPRDSCRSACTLWVPLIGTVVRRVWRVPQEVKGVSVPSL